MVILVVINLNFTLTAVRYTVRMCMYGIHGMYSTFKQILNSQWKKPVQELGGQMEEGAYYLENTVYSPMSSKILGIRN